MIAQFGVRQRLGTAGVLCVMIAGIAPDIDTAARLFGEQYFWDLHHALGHSVLSVLVLSFVVSTLGCWLGGIHSFGYLFGWCWVAAIVHCVTDAVYWWGIEPLWPVSSWEWCLNVIEYLDLVVLGIWLAGALALYQFRRYSVFIGALTLSSFAMYVGLRSVLPPPTGVFQLIAGGWMYAAPEGTPVLDWW